MLQNRKNDGLGGITVQERWPEKVAEVTSVFGLSVSPVGGKF